MRIGIDGNEANVKERVGVHQYAFEIINAIYKINKSSKKKNFYTIYLKNTASSDLPNENPYWKYKVLGGRKLWVVTKLMPHLILNPDCDVLFSTSHYLPPLTRTYKVCTIHDLGYLESSGQFKIFDFWQLKYWTAISIIASNKLIAISQSTKKDIVRHYKSATNKTAVVLHGYDSKRYNTDIALDNVRRIRKKYNIQEKYILFLSLIKPSKNVEGLIRAFSEFVTSNNDYTLVVAGKKGWHYEEIFSLVKELNLEDKIVFTGFVHEDDKAPLYYGARAFVLPAHWEGFGMTALEAMACGTPVVASRVGGFPEACGNAAIYVDNKDYHDIGKGIGKVVNVSENEYNMLVKSGLQQASKFSWEKAAKETIKVLESVRE